MQCKTPINQSGGLLIELRMVVVGSIPEMMVPNTGAPVDSLTLPKISNNKPYRS
jgi:hypothetical protein